MSTSSPEVLVVGEALVDIVIDGEHRHEHPGGSPMNVAYGLGHLGIPTLLRTSIGNDDRGRSLVGHANEVGVHVSNYSVGATPTATALATIGADRQASYEFNISWDVKSRPLPPSCRLLHSGSLATVLEPGAAAVLELFQHAPADALVSFDPNVRPGITPDRAAVVARIRQLASLAHVVKMSDEDAAWLHPDLGIDDVIDHHLDLGARLVAVTRGPVGCSLATREHRVQLPAPTVDVVDTIGAGDAFMSGLLWAIHTHDYADGIKNETLTAADITTIAQTALASARVTVSREGASPPDLSELAAALA